MRTRVSFLDILRLTSTVDERIHLYLSEHYLGKEKRDKVRRLMSLWNNLIVQITSLERSELEWRTLFFEQTKTPDAYPGVGEGKRLLIEEGCFSSLLVVLKTETSRFRRYKGPTILTRPYGLERYF